MKLNTIKLFLHNKLSRFIMQNEPYYVNSIEFDGFKGSEFDSFKKRMKK